MKILQRVGGKSHCTELIGSSRCATTLVTDLGQGAEVDDDLCIRLP